MLYIKQSFQSAQHSYFLQKRASPSTNIFSVPHPNAATTSGLILKSDIFPGDLCVCYSRSHPHLYREVKWKVFPRCSQRMWFVCKKDSLPSSQFLLVFERWAFVLFLNCAAMWCNTYLLFSKARFWLTFSLIHWSRPSCIPLINYAKACKLEHVIKRQQQSQSDNRATAASNQIRQYGATGSMRFISQHSQIKSLQQCRVLIYIIEQLSRYRGGPINQSRSSGPPSL